MHPSIAQETASNFCESLLGGAGARTAPSASLLWHLCVPLPLTLCSLLFAFWVVFTLLFLGLGGALCVALMDNPTLTLTAHGWSSAWMPAI